MELLEEPVLEPLQELAQALLQELGLALKDQVAMALQDVPADLLSFIRIKKVLVVDLDVLEDQDALDNLEVVQAHFLAVVTMVEPEVVAQDLIK